MSTQTVFGIELKNKLLAGIKKLNHSVSSTLGPGGRTVLIKDRLSLLMKQATVLPHQLY